MDGDSLEAALRDYGPAAIEDLLPRLRVIAEVLDQAHAAGRVHGSLHPRNIFIDADSTRVAGLDAGTDDAPPSIRPPYTAPEVAGGGEPGPASDQFALAAIAFEWMSGRRISGPALRPVEVRTMPGVDRGAMSAAFTRALSTEPVNRFASCSAFHRALTAAVIPALPLGTADKDDDFDTAFLPESAPIESDEIAPVAFAPVDLPPAEVPDLVIGETRFTEFEPKITPPAEPLTSWQPSGAFTPPPTQADRFSGGMLIAAALVGMVVGFAAGYMARPRALQTGPPAQTMATPSNGTDAAVSPTAPAPSAPTQAPKVAEAPEAPGSKAPQAPTNIGRLLVRSTPSGASVEVDGVARGVTPLALRDLALGSRTIAVASPGYVGEQRRVLLTRARPSRSLEIRLSAAAAASVRPSPSAAGRPGVISPRPAASGAGAGGSGTPAPSGQRPVVATGSMLIESRPSGAAVAVDGQPRGVTPVSIDALAPGDYRVTISLAGYRDFATTVRVVAGERTRAAASLSVQE